MNTAETSIITEPSAQSNSNSQVQTTLRRKKSGSILEEQEDQITPKKSKFSKNKKILSDKKSSIKK